MSRRVTIAGAGLAGALMAALLARRGFEVTVIERRPDLRRAAELSAGRSINLALSHRGIDALARAGIAERVLERAIPMRGRLIHDARGRLAFQRYGVSEEQVIRSIGRGELNGMLLDLAASLPGVELRFEQKVVDVDLDGGRLHLEHARTGETEALDAPVVIGADGAFSAVRGRLLRTERFDYSQSFLAHGYKELLLPPAPDGGFALEPNALHIWPRGGFMLIALPNADRSFTCTLFLPHEGAAGSFAALRTEAEVRAFFERWFPDFVPLIPDLGAAFLANPTGSLVTVRCYPWHRDRCALIGDAAHAVVPFYGQGMNAAFEDCAILDALLERAGPDPDWEQLFAAFGAQRKPHADALADLAIANYEEMRAKVASRLFLLEKSLEKAIHRLLPRHYLPLYTMVTFTRIPYADAARRARRQRQTLLLGLVTAVLLLALTLALAL